MLLALRKVEEEAISFVFCMILVLAGEEVTRFPTLFRQRHLFGAAMALRYIALHSDILRYHVWIVLQSSHAE